jgi:ABC-2 type transport system permease protein
MAADTVPSLPVLRGVLDNQRRTLVLWGIAVAAICAMYAAFYPAMGGGEEMEALLAAMPQALVEAMGYDQIGTAPGYLTSTVYGLLAPILLLVFAIGTGARLIAGQEEDGTLELELASPTPAAGVPGTLASLWLDLWSSWSPW